MKYIVTLREEWTASSARKDYILMFPGTGCFRAPFSLNLPWLDWRRKVPFHLCLCASALCLRAEHMAEAIHPWLCLFFGKHRLVSCRGHTVLHIASCAPCLLSFRNLPECMPFVVFWLIEHCFNYYWTEQTWNFCYFAALATTVSRQQIQDSGCSELMLNYTGWHGLPLIGTCFGQNTPSGKMRLH